MENKENKDKKFKRLADRLNELSALNVNIGRLAFYVNENDVEDGAKEVMEEQLNAMCHYRNALQARILKGIY